MISMASMARFWARYAAACIAFGLAIDRESAARLATHDNWLSVAVAAFGLLVAIGFKGEEHE